MLTSPHYDLPSLHHRARDNLVTLMRMLTYKELAGGTSWCAQIRLDHLQRTGGGTSQGNNCSFTKNWWWNLTGCSLTNNCSFTKNWWLKVVSKLSAEFYGEA